MPEDRRDYVPHFGEDYDLARWSDGTRDEEGNLNWFETLPSNDEWERVKLVTLDFDPEGEHDYRNFPIDPTRPLDPYGSFHGQDEYYDLDDLAAQAFDYYGFEF